MKQEPVAWITTKGALAFCDAKFGYEQGWTPLFASPQYKDFKYDPETGEPLIDGYPLFSGLPPPQYRELSDEDRLAFTKAYFNIHPEAHLSEQFKIKLYELNDFARAILKKASEK